MKISKGDIVCVVCSSFKLIAKAKGINSCGDRVVFGNKGTTLVEQSPGKLVLYHSSSGVSNNVVLNIRVNKRKDIRKFNNEVFKSLVIDEIYCFIEDIHYDIPELLYTGRIKRLKSPIVLYLAYFMMMSVKAFILKKLDLKSHLPLQERESLRIKEIEDSFLLIIEDKNEK